MIELVISGDVNEVIKVSGPYSIDLNSGRNIVITPHKENYAFTPESISITDIQADMTGQDFEADFVQAVENNSTNDFFMVYPNPATELLFINSDSNTELSVFSLGGMKVMESIINMGVNTLDIQALIPGIYIIRMEGDRKARAIKFVKR